MEASLRSILFLPYSPPFEFELHANDPMQFWQVHDNEIMRWFCNARCHADIADDELSLISEEYITFPRGIKFT